MPRLSRTTIEYLVSIVCCSKQNKSKQKQRNKPWAPIRRLTAMTIHTITIILMTTRHHPVVLRQNMRTPCVVPTEVAPSLRRVLRLTTNKAK